MKLKDKTLSANTGLDAIKRAPIVEYDTGLKCIRIQDISQGKNYDEWGFTETNEKDRKKFLLKKNDLLIARTGATVGVSQFIKEDTEAVYNNGTIRLRLEKSLNPRFVYYIFQTKGFLQYIDNISCVATQPNLRIEGLLRFTIPDYSIEKQNAIVKTLSTFDDLIENNNKRIKLLKQMAENLYKEWFVRFRFPGYETVEFEGKSPKCWNQLRLDQFGIQLESGARPKGGINSSIDDGVPSLGAESVKGLAEFDYSDVKLIPEEFYRKLKRGKNRGNHILIYKDGAYIGKVTLFKYGFPFERFAINEHVFFMNSIRAEYQNYLYFTLKQTSYFTLMQNLNRNAAQPGLSQLDINRIKIIEPDQVTVISFNDIIEPILKKVFQLAKKNHLLIKQRDMLLPRLMSGKLEV